MDLFKGRAKDYPVRIREWDERTDRDWEDTKVVGRPTRAFGTSVFEYAGKTYPPTPWEENEDLEDLKKYLEKWLSVEYDRPVEFTFCLCGLYEYSWDEIPHHSDTVPTYNDLVVGVSYGSPRILEWLTYRGDIKAETNTSKTHFIKYAEEIADYWEPTKTSYLLEDGDVYVFDGHSQMCSTHAIPPLVGTGSRYSLTFRTGI